MFVDRFAKALILEPAEGSLLDVDQVRKFEDVLQARETLARAGRSNIAAQMWELPLLRRAGARI